MQTRRFSLAESLTNLAVGMAISWALADLFLPLFGYEPAASSNAAVVLVYTLASGVRSYTIRRAFNRWAA